MHWTRDCASVSFEHHWPAPVMRSVSQKSMPSWSIGFPEKERLEVSLSPEVASDDGYEWLSARVRINVGGFAGEVSMSLLFSELTRFKEELEPLYRTLSGKAEFKTIEGQLHLLVEVDRLGHVKATGELLDAAGVGNRLRFEIHFDQTLLWHTISELDESLFEIRENKG
jgi:hypothetical protein